jgi:hypothetical protein
MTKPQRIQLKRTKGWRMPPNTVRVDRSTKWGNPFKVGQTHHMGIKFADGPLTAEEAVVLFRNEVGCKVSDFPRTFDELRGKNLACWCKLGDPCHGDVLLEIANADEAPSTNGAVK